MKLKPKTHLNRGYAFLKYVDDRVSDFALNEPQFIDGRQFECRVCEDDNENHFPQKEIQKFRLYVRCLAPNETKTDLKNYFGQFGSITQAYVIKEPQSDTISRCYGFVHFQSKESSKLALELTKKNPHERWIICMYQKGINAQNSPTKKEKIAVDYVERKGFQGQENCLAAGQNLDIISSPKKQGPVIQKSISQNNERFSAPRIYYDNCYPDGYHYKN
jgi:RNA recognition motif-containing protein